MRGREGGRGGVGRSAGPPSLLVPHPPPSLVLSNEYTPAEQLSGLHARSMRFAHETSVHGGSQHGSSRFGSRNPSKANLAALNEPNVDDSARGGKLRPDSAKI